MEVSSLKHVRRHLKSGGQVIVVDTGAVLNAESLAMIQAMHSRSIGGFDAHMEILAKKGPQKFMETFYSGYGHKSIGDCGFATVFIEGVSMLVPKAVQDWFAYNGQESSTRFMDFSKQTFMNPLGSEDGRNIQEAWRTAYLRGLEWLKEVSLKSRFPKKDSEDEKTYEKAINARACDIMRSFLPAGTQTNLSWTMNLRQFEDEFLWLRHHPLEEVREVALATEDALSEMYPASFLKKRYAETEDYIEYMAKQVTYFDMVFPVDFRLSENLVSRTTLMQNIYQGAIANRPPKTELPRKIRECGTLQFDFLLDFGSFRDIQRHRAVIQQMPILSTRHGFHPWYLDELDDSLLQNEMVMLIQSQTKKIEALPTNQETKQYYTGMGFNTTNRLTGDLHALTYLVELRGKWDVHPTLRERALQIAEVLTKSFGIKLYLDPEPNRFDVRRGAQDITFK
jgi:thymidylate synthase ThyX